MSMLDIEKRLFIEQQLNKLSTPVIIDKKEAKILCPFHDDTNPSLGVSLVRTNKVSVGGFHCWSCHAKGGWNQLAEKLKLDTWDNKEQKAVMDATPKNGFADLKNILNNITVRQQESIVKYQKPLTEGPWDTEWRGIPASFLASLGIEKYWDDRYSEYRLWIPFYDLNNQLIGHVLARANKHESNIPDDYKYLNSTNFPSTSAWLFLHLEKNPKWVVIVEGPFDAIRLRYFGIPAIAMFGVSTFLMDDKGVSPKVAALSAQGVKSVLLALDADDAGIAATPQLYYVLNKYLIAGFDFNFRRYRKDYNDPNEKIDGGDCPIEAIQEMKNFILQNS